MKKVLVSIIVIGLLLTTSIVSVNAFVVIEKSKEMQNKYRIPTGTDYDMLIFISPQYAGDADIHEAINKYITAVEEDIGWNTKIIKIAPNINDFKKIDNIIESYYEACKIKACIMVGEDTDTALGSDINYNDAPSTVPWHTLGGESAYEIGEHGVVGDFHQMDVCVSLLYPTSDLSYYKKSSQLVSVFEKFSKNRDFYFTGEMLVFADIMGYDEVERMYNSMEQYGNLDYTKDPTFFEVLCSLDDSYSMYFVDGHSVPSFTDVHSTKNVFFYSLFLNQLDTPFFGASGCYVSGWYTGKTDNNILDPSITRIGHPHYSSRIFINPHLRVMVLGDLTQSGYSWFSVSFIENALQGLMSGKTLAESMTGTIVTADDQTVIGDPTFRYIMSNHFILEIIKKTS